MLVKMIGGPADGRSLLLDERLDIAQPPRLCTLWDANREVLSDQLLFGLHTYLITANHAIYMGRRKYDETDRLPAR